MQFSFQGFPSSWNHKEFQIEALWIIPLHSPEAWHRNGNSKLQKEITNFMWTHIQTVLQLNKIHAWIDPHPSSNATYRNECTSKRVTRCQKYHSVQLWNSQRNIVRHDTLPLVRYTGHMLIAKYPSSHLYVSEKWGAGWHLSLAYVEFFWLSKCGKSACHSVRE